MGVRNRWYRRSSSSRPDGDSPKLPRETRLEILRRLDAGESTDVVASALQVSVRQVHQAEAWRSHIRARGNPTAHRRATRHYLERTRV